MILNIYLIFIVFYKPKYINIIKIKLLLNYLNKNKAI